MSYRCTNHCSISAPLFLGHEPNFLKAIFCSMSSLFFSKRSLVITVIVLLYFPLVGQRPQHAVS